MQIDPEEEWSTNYTVFFNIITPEFNASRNVADKEISIAASHGLPELTQNVIRSSHGHSAPSLKISCKLVQLFSRNVADKEISIAASCGLPELTQNVITSSHGHSTPYLKISCKSVQPFSRNVADKEISIAALHGLPELTKKATCVKLYRRTDRQTDERMPDAGRLYDSQKNYSNCCHQMSDFKMHQRSDNTDKDCAAQ